MKLIEAARPSEDKTDEMMHIRLTVAKACKAYADQLKAEERHATRKFASCCVTDEATSLM